MRGKPVVCVYSINNNRITPAGAGKTLIENVGAGYKYGSPPQVRGKPDRAVLVGELGRITPAGAGKTLKRSFRNQPFCS